MFLKILPFLSILIFRFIGLFIVLPVISLLVSAMPHANAWNVGLAIGAPYLFQMLFQPFFGRFSDKYGRKPILILGLVIFFIGTIICMFEDSVYYLIVGRCIQGIGAVGGILTALVADSVREDKRTSAMALMGIGIFVSFLIAMFLGSILGARYGLNSLFLLSAIVTLVSIFIALIFVKPTPKIDYIYPQHEVHIENERLIQRSIIAMNFSNFIQKMLMILTFALIPIILNEHIEKTEFWIIYIPAMLVSIIALGPTSIISEKKGKSKVVLLVSIIIFFLSYSYMLFWYGNLIMFGVSVALFFIAFSMQEALLQSMISKYAKAKNRGGIIGDFVAFGFGGSFIGAMIGGHFSNYDSIISLSYILFCSLILLSVIWFFSIIIMVKDTHTYKTMYVSLGDIKLKDLEEINNIVGIMEWYENIYDNLLIIKYNSEILESNYINKILGVKNN